MKPQTKLKKSFALVLTVTVLVVGMTTLVLFLWYQSLLTPVSTVGDNKPFAVEAGMSGITIAENLKREGLIKNVLAFRILSRVKKVGDRFGEGVFYLSPTMNAQEIATALTGTGEIDIKVTFLEGWRNEEYAKVLSEKLEIDPDAFLANARQGYMFPDTYLLNKKVTPPDVATTLRLTFDKRVDDELQAKLLKQGVTLNEAITLASIVERESHDKIPNERKMIASVLLNRLRIAMPLQADATVQYALGYDQVQKKWWRVVTREQLQTTQSPYNTYLNVGLPPGPICNPGLASITAVAEAADTPYLYYIHGKDGTPYFAKTLDEHNRNQQKYL